MKVEFLTVINYLGMDGGKIINKSAILFIVFIFLFYINTRSQDLKCDSINSNLKELNDTSLKWMFEKTSSSKVLLFGEYHGNKHSIIYPKVISRSLSYGYNTIIFELPVSYNLLFDELLESDEFSPVTANLIAREVYNKKDFLKTLKSIYILNKSHPIKVICPDLEHSLIIAKDRIFDILYKHKATLNDEFLDLYKKIEIVSEKFVVSEGECAILFKDIVESENEGKYNDEKCLKQHFYLFKNILKSVELNGKITGKNYEVGDRELFMANTLLQYFKADTNMKAIGFFGSIHTRLNVDTSASKYVPKTPFAKMLNNSNILNGKVSTVFINYRYNKEAFKYYQKDLFGSSIRCFEINKLNPKKEYLFFVSRNNEISDKIRNYSFILYL